jgi:hypothetical protein
MKEYMFLYRGGDPTWTEAPAAEKAAVMAMWGAWMGALAEKGQLVSGGSPLHFEGKRLLAKDGVLTDIAAAEVKELVSGYSVIKAEGYEHAAEIARACPILRVPGAGIEIRPVAAM